MTFGTTFTYQCGKCNYKYSFSKYDMTLFMVEHHILESDHLYGTFTKSKLDDNWNDVPIYKKYSVYLGLKDRFKMSSSAGNLLKTLKKCAQ